MVTSSPNRRMLARIARDGTATAVTESDVLVGTNLRGVAPRDGGYVVAVDSAPMSGSQLGTVYAMAADGTSPQRGHTSSSACPATGYEMQDLTVRLPSAPCVSRCFLVACGAQAPRCAPVLALHPAADGTYSEWGLAQGHSGISDLVPAPQGGFYFTDFENDNIWHITTPGEAETPVLTASPGALMSVAVSRTGEIAAVNWVPGEWWSNGGVNAVYRVAGDAATLAAEAPEGSQLFAIAGARGGIFGDAFYITDTKGGTVFRLEADNRLTPVITGLRSPGRIAFDPATGDMVVVCDGQYLIWFGANLSAFAVPNETAPFEGLFFTDFENDNVWFVPGEGRGEVPILEGTTPAGLGPVAHSDVDNTVYALNWQGSGWPFGGEDGAYAVQPNGAAIQVLRGNFAGIAMSTGGPFGKALYLSDAQAGKVLRLEGGVAAEAVAGLVAPGALTFDPLTGRMVVLCDGGRQVAWIGARLAPAAAGEPGSVGTFFVPAEQPHADVAETRVDGSTVARAVPDNRPACC